MECTIKSCSHEGIKLGYCHNCRRKLQRRGIDTRGLAEMPDHPTAPPGMTEDELHTARACRKMGWSYVKIAAHLSLSKVTVWRRLTA